MLVTISTIIGMLAPFASELFPLLKKNQEHKYALELKKLDMQGRTNASYHEYNKVLLEQQAKIIEASYKHDASMETGPIINAIRALVRPVITFSFFALFVGIQITMLVAALDAGVPIDIALPALWTVDTQAIFASIMGFWFSSRLIKHNKEKIINTLK